MARPKKANAPDLSQRVMLTAGLIERLVCPIGKQQVFMRDTEAPGLILVPNSTVHAQSPSAKSRVVILL